MRVIQFVAIYVFGLTAVIIVIACKNPSSGMGSTGTKYSVAYDLNGGVGGSEPTDADTYVEGASVTAKELPSNISGPGGKVFAGWNTRANGGGENVAAGGTIAMPSGGLILYAKWSALYSVTYNLNGGTEGTAPTDADTYVEGATVTAKALPSGIRAPAGKVFVGWKTESDESDSEIDSEIDSEVAPGETIAMPSGGLTLYAKWADAYFVTYDLNGGVGGSAPTDDNTYIAGATVTAKALPSGIRAPAGKVFVGWKTESDESDSEIVPGGTIAMPSGGGLTLYAKWVDAYFVTYDLNGGEGGTAPTDADTYVIDASVTAKALPSNISGPGGKVFAGWNTKSDGRGSEVAPGGTIAMLSGGLTLYARWSALYSVTYYLNGGTGDAPTDADTYVAGASVTAKALPSGISAPADKVFAGWNTESDGNGSEVAPGGTIAMPSGGLTLYAKWVDAYSVTYDLNGGEGGTAPTDADTYVAGASVTAKALPSGISAPADKVFAGWNTKSDGNGSEVAPGGTIAMPSGGLTLYARWSALYSVTYDLNGGKGGTVPTDGNTYVIGASVTAKALPSGISAPADKVFAGWNTERNGSGSEVAPGGTIAMPSGGLTLYAKWVNRTYSVAYDLNGGEGGTAPTDDNTYIAGASVTAKALPSGIRAPAGKGFAGWSTWANGGGENVAAGGTIAMPRGGLTLYAKWFTVYSVTYDLNGGTGGTAPRDADTYVVGASVTAKELPPSISNPNGSAFISWNTESDGSGSEVAPGGTIAMPRGGLTLYAKWSTVYSVTYDLNDGTGDAPRDADTYVVGASVTAKALPSGIRAPAGKVFAGWNTRANGRGRNVAAGGTIAMPRGGLTLYAKWSTVYSVTYYLNGGTGGTAPRDADTYVVGASVTAKALPSGIRAPAAKVFAGWNTRANGRGRNVAAGGTIAMPRGGLTLYAKWVDAYSVTYDLNGGRGGTAPRDADTYVVGASVTAKALPSNIRGPGGKSFAGWNTRANGRGRNVAAGGTIAMPRGGLALYAKWADAYFVTYDLNGGVGGTAPRDADTYTTGASVTAKALPPGISNPNGSAFISWNTQANGRGRDVEAGGTIAMLRGGLTLYAKWRWRR